MRPNVDTTATDLCSLFGRVWGRQGELLGAPAAEHRLRHILNEWQASPLLLRTPSRVCCNLLLSTAYIFWIMVSSYLFFLLHIPYRMHSLSVLQGWVDPQDPCFCICRNTAGNVVSVALDIPGGYGEGGKHYLDLYISVSFANADYFCVAERGP